jgi:pre-mRNA-processing factor 8
VFADDTSLKYIVPQNLFDKFVTISDLESEIGGLLYGVTPPDQAYVREVRAIVLPPQLGTHQEVTFARQLPEHPILSTMQPLGWIHTHRQDSTEAPGMSLIDGVMHADMISEYKSWVGDACVVMELLFAPGMISFAGFKLTPVGFEFAKTVKNPRDPTVKGWSDQMYQLVHVQLSRAILGSFLVPEEGSWNYYFRGIQHRADMPYSVQLGVPKEFYHETHRPTHFLKFAEDITSAVSQPEPMAGQSSSSSSSSSRPPAFGPSGTEADEEGDDGANDIEQEDLYE